MKTLLNREFLDLAGDRNYPLEEGATGISDGGTKLPDNILADAQLAISPTLGNSIFVVSAAISDSIVSVTFATTDSVDLGGLSPITADAYGDPTSTTSDDLEYFGYQTNFLEETTPTFEGVGANIDPIIPVGVAVATKKEVTLGLPIKVEALIEGVSGSVIFDSNTFENANNSWTFGTYVQSALSRRAYHVVGLNRVELFKKEGAKPTARGDVIFDGENGLTVTLIESASIIRDGGEEIVRDVIEIGFAGPLTRENMDKYSGPCAVRPDAGNCLLGTPITSVNGVSPDSNGVLHILFPHAMKPYRMSGGIIVDTADGAPIRSICGPRFNSILEDGTIGSDDCCDEGCEYNDPDCIPCDSGECIDTERVAGAARVMYYPTPIIEGASSHVCLNVFSLVFHEYNIDDEGVDKTYLSFAGAVGNSYIYAEDVSDLSVGFVAYINVIKNLFYFTEYGTINNLLRGRLSSTGCRTSEIIYIDGTESEVSLIVAPVSILDTVGASQHSLNVSLSKTPSDGPVVPTPFLANGDYCETKYGMFSPEDPTYKQSYYIKFNPYGNYGFSLHALVDDTVIPMTSGNMEVIEESSSGSSGGGNYLNADVSFTYQGYDYSGAITSVEGGCTSS